MNPIILATLFVIYFATLLISDYSLYGIEHFVVGVPLFLNIAARASSGRGVAARGLSSIADSVHLDTLLSKRFTLGGYTGISGLDSLALRRGFVLIVCIAPGLVCLAVEYSTKWKLIKLADPSTSFPAVKHRTRVSTRRRTYYLYYFSGSSVTPRIRRTLCSTTVAALDLAFQGSVKHTEHSVMPLYSATEGWTNFTVEDFEPQVGALASTSDKPELESQDMKEDRLKSSKSSDSPRSEFGAHETRRFTPPKAVLEDLFLIKSAPESTQSAALVLPDSPCYELPLEIDDFKVPDSPTKSGQKPCRGSSLITQLGLQPVSSLGLGFHFGKPMASARPFWQTMPASSGFLKAPVFERRTSMPNLGHRHNKVAPCAGRPLSSGAFMDKLTSQSHKREAMDLESYFPNTGLFDVIQNKQPFLAPYDRATVEKKSPLKAFSMESPPVKRFDASKIGRFANFMLEQGY